MRCETLIWTPDAHHILLHCNLVTGPAVWAGVSSCVALSCKAVLLELFAHESIITVPSASIHFSYGGISPVSMAGMQDGKHLAILTDILEDAKAQLSLKVAVCTILRAAAQADAVSMSALTQVSYSCTLAGPLLKPATVLPHTQLLMSSDSRILAVLAEQPWSQKAGALWNPLEQWPRA